MPRSPRPEIEPQIVVRGGDLLAQIWPDERPLAVATLAVDADGAIGDGERVLELLAAADLDDVDSYAWRHARDAAAVLALTHHRSRDVLAAALEVDGVLSPSEVLGVLRAKDASFVAHLAS
jgi:hypothetical protein